MVTSGKNTGRLSMRLPKDVTKEQDKNIKMAGTVPTAGITLTDDKNVQTKLPMDMIAMPPLEGTSTVNTPQTRKEEVVSSFSVSHHCLCRSDPIKCTETFSEIGGRSKTGHISYLTDIVLPGFK